MKEKPDTGAASLVVLKQYLAAFDGRHTTLLEAYVQRHPPTKPVISMLLDHACHQEPLIQAAATWVFHQYLLNGYRLPRDQLTQWVSILPDLGHWQSRLHACRTLDRLEITPQDKDSIEWFVRYCLSDNNKFVRAWAYHSFASLARKFPEYGTEAEQLLEMAMRDEAPSVKARIRNIQKKPGS